MGDALQGTNPYIYALSCMSGKWKLSIINHINHYGYIRFSNTKKTFPISEKVLSQQLKELVSDGLVERIQYNEIPLRVEYRLTPAGQKLIPAADLIYAWSIERMSELGIEIDPDAFLVHPEERYNTVVKDILDKYDLVCESVSVAKSKGMTAEDMLEAVKAYDKSSK
jgi:Predicted transcriptional regulators